MFDFSEDMLPRHFPKVHLPNTKQLDETVTIPQPTLPNVSLIFSNGVNANPMQQSLPVWKEAQCRAKSVKKHVRFAANIDQHKPVGRTEIESKFDSRSNFLEISFLEPSRKGDEKMTNDRPKSECVNRSPFQTNFQRRAQSTELLNQNRFTWSPFLSRHDLPESNENQPNKMKQSKENTVRFHRSGMAGEHSGQMESCAEILVNILEEQQRHIAFQRSQILMQEKQSLEQQKQICMLECQIEKLLLQNEAHDIHLLHSAEHDAMNASNAENIARELSSEPMNCGMSVAGAIKEKNSTNFGIKEMDLNSGAHHEGFMFDRTIRTVESATFDCEFDASANTKSRINFTTQTSICERSTNCGSYIHSQVATDRSFVLNMLGMKYKCMEDEGSLSNDPQCVYQTRSNPKGHHNEFSEDGPSEMHNYLVRHGLIKG